MKEKQIFKGLDVMTEKDHALYEELTELMKKYDVKAYIIAIDTGEKTTVAGRTPRWFAFETIGRIIETFDINQFEIILIYETARAARGREK